MTRESFPKRALDGAEIALLFRREQRVRVSRQLGARGAAYPVDIVLGLVRDVEVHH